MAYADLDDLLEAAAEIMQLDAAESSLGKGREWKAAKKQYEVAIEQFKTKRKNYVNGLLVKGEEWVTIPDDVAHQLDTIEAGADPSWHPAIQYTRDNLLPYLNKEARKKPWVRDFIKWTPAAFGIAVAVAYFGIKLTSGVTISEAIESRAGLQQRAAAAQKALRYDEWMGTRVRRGGWLKGIMFWPIEPSETEIKGAAEFMGLILGAHSTLAGEGAICGTLVSPSDTLSDQQIALVESVAAHVRDDSTEWRSPPVMTILAPIQRAFPC